MGKILITGALGNVGRFVAEYAIQFNQDVVVADINKERLNEVYEGRAEIVLFDFMNKSTFTSALKDVDRVFIMRPPHLGKPKDLKPFIDALKTHGKIELICFLSLLGVENNPVPPHHKIEKIIESTGIPYCHLRPSFFMQNISGVHAFEIKYLNKIVVPVNNAVTSFIDAQDIGEFAAKALSQYNEHQNKAYSITGPVAIDYWDVAKILTKVLGREINYVNPAPSFAKKYWVQVRGLDKEYCSVMDMLYMMTRFGAAKKVTNVFEEVMQRKPRSFEQFAEDNKKAWI